jgi:transcriptional regulator with XRE-family HTH domain
VRVVAVGDGLGQRLRFARTELVGMTQTQVERSIGVPKARVSRYETGHVTPSVPILVKFADCYDVSIDWLLGRSEVIRIPRAFARADA